MDTNRTTILLNEYLLNQLGPHQREELAALLLTPEGEKLFSTNFDAEIRRHQFETEEELDKVYERLTQQLLQNIRKEQQTEKRPLAAGRVYRSATWWWAAAIILGVVVTAGVLFMARETKPAVKLVAKKDNNQIAPGQAGAILTLADGSNMVLDSLQHGIIAEEEGVKIQLAHGQLNYTADNGVIHENAYHLLTTPKGRQFCLRLPDGSAIWLNSASSVRFPASFTGKKRIVDITGEAYFEIKENAGMPFIVNVNGRQASIEVLGTSFNVNAYENENGIRTTLLDGKIKLNGGGNARVLSPGQGALLLHEKIDVENNTDTDKVIAWKNGFFNFQDVSLPQAMRMLERWYDIEVVYEKEIPSIYFGGKMSMHIGLQDALAGLSGAGVHFRQEERKIIVMNKR